MTRFRNVGGVLFVTGVLCGLLIAAIVDRWFPPREDADLRHYRAVRDFVEQEFVRDVTTEELLDHALHGMVQGLDDYSRYYDREEARELERGTEGRFVGIGVIFRTGLPDGEEHRILFALPGTPAHDAGLQVGDRLVAIDGEPTDTMSPDDRGRALGDPSQHELELVVESLAGEARTVLVKRRSIVDPTVRHGRIVDGERGIGYVACLSFSHETAAEFDRAVEGLAARGMKGLVLDLRGNRGGVLEAGVAIARRFLSEGLIVSTEGRQEALVYEAESSEATLAGLPLVLLVDQGTASASEVLAAALQEHRAAVIVGHGTYGKGLVQTIRRFPSREAVAKITTAYYYTPSHRNLERSLDPDREFGIVPDLEVPVPAPERRAVLRHLLSYAPPEGALPALRAWEERESVELIRLHPADAQLDAAVELLSGGRPEGYLVPRDHGDR